MTPAENAEREARAYVRQQEAIARAVAKGRIIQTGRTVEVLIDVTPLEEGK
jgi:hypothetical protein